MKNLLLVGCGAMGRYVWNALRRDERVCVACILEAPSRVPALQREHGSAIRIVGSLDEVAERPDFALECAGHEAVRTSVVELLSRGIDTVIASVGALAEEGLPEKLERAASDGRAQLTLVPGAIGGIDALAAAGLGRLESVRYVGRKPPKAWLGTKAEERADLTALQGAATLFEGNAREAARLYPKNANVAAMIALAGIGFERTEVSLIADPAVTRNTHLVNARGAFGELQVLVSANPLAENPKTSELAALSVLRSVRSKLASLSF